MKGSRRSPEGARLSEEAAREPEAPLQVVRRPWVIGRRTGLVFGGVALLGVIFVGLALTLRSAPGTSADVAITHAVQRIDAPAFTEAMVAISAIGYAPWTWVMVAVASAGLLTFGLWREALFVLATEGAGTLTTFVKMLVERPRPTPDVVHVTSHLLDYSFPSGHVVGYTALYGFLFFVLYVRFKTGWARTAALAIFGALVALVGVSRIHLGYHWASDVLGGYAFGAAYLLILIEIYRLVAPKPRAMADPGTRPPPADRPAEAIGATTAATGR